MGAFRSLLVSFLAVGGTSAASAVLDLIPSNFDDVVLKSGKPALVEFFAPWCGRKSPARTAKLRKELVDCKTLAPIYEELAQNFQWAESKMVIGKVDADEHKDLGRKFGVQGFPTLKYFDGKSKDPIDYNSGRDLASLSAFLTEKTGLKPRMKTVQSEVTMLNDAKFKEVIGGDKNVLVAFTAPWCGHCKTLAPTWEALAKDFVSEPNVIIAKVDAESPDSKATADDQGVKGFPTIKWFKAGSKTAEDYQGGRGEDALVEFVNTNAGTSRTAGGKLSATAGTISSIDTIVQKLLGSGNGFASGADDVIKAVKAQTQNTFTEYYLKVAQKFQSNSEYVEKELRRLQNILKKGGLTPEKTDELTTRSNILKKFTIAKDDGKSEL